MKRAAIYVRVSTDEQGDSVGAQLAALRDYVAAHDDLTMAGEYIDEGISGQKYAQRDDLQRLLADVDAGKIDIILFTKLDRWFRSVRHYTATQAQLDRRGVGWLAIWEPIYDTTTPSGRLIVNQMMAIAQFEAENTGSRIKQVFAYKIAQGEVVSGNPPVGYVIQDKHLVPGPEADAVKEMFEHFSRHGSLVGAQRVFIARTGRPIVRQSVKRMLTEEVYIGRYRGNDNYCPPIVSKDLFEDCGRKVKMNVKSAQKYTYTFSGLVRCDVCGCVMAGQLDYKRYKDKVYRRPYYRCPRHYMRGVQLCANQKTIFETTLEKYLVENIASLATAFKLEYREKEKPARDAERNRAAIEKKIGRLKDLYVNELISLDEYKQDRARYEQDLALLAPCEPSEPRDFSALDKLSGAGFRAFYDTMTASEKRYLWRSIIKEIRMDRDKKLTVIFL